MLQLLFLPQIKMCARLRWFSEIRGGIKEGMDTLGFDTGNSTTVETMASSQHTTLKPASPGESQGSVLQQKVLSWEQTKEFSSVRQSPVQKEGKADMFGQGVRVPKTVPGEHPDECQGRHEGGPQKPRGRLGQEKHLHVSWVTSPFVLYIQFLGQSYSVLMTYMAMRLYFLVEGLPNLDYRNASDSSTYQGREPFPIHRDHVSAKMSFCPALLPKISQ